MNRVGICFWMMVKRMGRHPVYWVMLLLFPAALFVVPKFNRAVNEEQITVGYVLEGVELPESKRKESERVITTEETAGEMPSYSAQLLYLMDEKLSCSPSERKDGLFRYIKYTDIDTMKRDVRTGEISCGVAFGREFAERLSEQDYRHCITLYLPEGMNVGGMVQEDVFSRLYQVYSAVWYAGKLKEQGYQAGPEEVLRKFAKYQDEGKVFAVSYETVSGKDNGTVSETAEDEKAMGYAVDGGNETSETSLLSLRGILAFLTLMSAALGALDSARDRGRGTGKGISYPHSLTMAAAGAPILLSTLFLAGGMIFVGTETETTRVSYRSESVKTVSERQTKMEDFIPDLQEEMSGIVTGAPALQADILSELGSAFLYGFVLWMLAILFGRILPERMLEGVMPCFLLSVLLCCPIFFDLGESIPLIGQISKLFPVTWYLEFWG